MSSSGQLRSSSALYHTCNCTTLANCTTLGARGDENRTRARFTRTRSPAESILIHEATTSVGEAMTCQRSRRGGSLPPPADRWRGGVGRGRRRRTRASGMLIPSWRAHLHPLVDDDARAALVTRHTLAFGPAVARVLYFRNFLCGISSIHSVHLKLFIPRSRQQCQCTEV